MPVTTSICIPTLHSNACVLARAPTTSHGAEDEIAHVDLPRRTVRLLVQFRVKLRQGNRLAVPAQEFAAVSCGEHVVERLPNRHWRVPLLDLDQQVGPV